MSAAAGAIPTFTVVTFRTWAVWHSIPASLHPGSGLWCASALVSGSEQSHSHFLAGFSSYFILTLILSQLGSIFTGKNLPIYFWNGVAASTSKGQRHRKAKVCAALNAHPAFDAPFLIDPNLVIGTNVFHDLDSEKLQVL